MSCANQEQQDILDATSQAVEKKWLPGQVKNLVPELNNQRWDQSAAKELNDALEGNITDDYFNAQDPNLAVQKETPKHRLMITMRVQGATLTDIADAVGCTVPWVSQVLRQPWARKRMAALQNEAGISGIQKKLESYGQEALETLKEIVDDQNTPSNVRSNAAMYLVNRFLGKPKESLVIDDRRSADDLTNDELARIAATATSNA